LETEILSEDTYISGAAGRKGMNLAQSNSNILKYLVERNPQFRLNSAAHDTFQPVETHAKIEIFKDEKTRDERQIKFGSFIPDYEYRGELSGSVSKKKEARQIKFDPLRVQDLSQAYQLPPDFYWRRDF